MRAQILQRRRLIVVLAFSIIIPNAWTSSSPTTGVAFSPFLRKGDSPTSQAYSQEMVKVMLEVLLDGSYTTVTTYGVGSPNRPYDNHSIEDSSSEVHTALAAAQLNKEKGHLAMTVYLGLYNHPSENQAKSEIEIGLTVAQESNDIFSGTVTAVVYPSTVDFNDLLDNPDLNARMKAVSTRAKALNMKFGVRVPDCVDIPNRSKGQVKDVVDQCDFIICLLSPAESDFKFETDKFENAKLQEFLDVEQSIKNRILVGSDKDFELILETGWPGDLESKTPNTVGDLTTYWEQVSEWCTQKGKKLFLHEAFDIPWKNKAFPLGGHFGRWKYNEDEPNLLSKNAYELKGDPIPPFLRKYGIPLASALVGGICILLLISVITLLYKRLRRVEGATAALLSENDMDKFFHGLSEDNGKTNYAADIWETSPYNTQFECNTTELEIDKTDAGLLGKGQFGYVYRGKLVLSNCSQDVAIKMTGPFCLREEILCLLSEIKILTYLGPHEHICSLLCAYTKEISKGNVYFAMELCEHGNLERFLLKNRAKFEVDLGWRTVANNYVTSFPSDNESLFCMSEIQLTRWSYQIASAMDFISSKNVIHSDLAARNILLTWDYCAKVTDFGLSRRFLEEIPTYAKTGSEPLPWRWLAPESLETKAFSTKSDVWSYSVTVWEIFTLGASPQYESANSWKELLPALQRGERLNMPDNVPDNISRIMAECWRLRPEDRPTFAQIKLSLMPMIDSGYDKLVE